MDYNNNSSPFSLIVNHFESRELIGIRVDWEAQRIFFNMYHSQVSLGCCLSIANEGRSLHLVFVYPFLASDPKIRPSVAELVVRANYGLVAGSFQLDMNDGVIHLEIEHHMDDSSSLTEEMLTFLFSRGMRIADRYYPAFMQHMHSGVTPEDAIFMAELDMHADDVEVPPVSTKQKTKRQTKNGGKSKKGPAEDGGTGA